MATDRPDTYRWALSAADAADAISHLELNTEPEHPVAHLDASLHSKLSDVVKTLREVACAMNNGELPKRPSEPKDIRCNRCGSSCLVNESGVSQPCGLLGAKAVGGYIDSFPPDYEVWTLNLCESCLAWLVTTFVAYPATADYEGDPSVPNEQIRALLVEGKTEGLYPKMVASYARAMSRVSIDPKESDKKLRRVSEAARGAAATIERMQLEERDRWLRISKALDAAGAPRLEALEERAAALAVGTPKGRMLAVVESLYRSLYARWVKDMRAGDEPQTRFECQALEDGRAVLEGAGRDVSAIESGGEYR